MSTNTLRMLAFVMPAEVSRSLIAPPDNTPPSAILGPMSWFEDNGGLRGMVAVVTGGAGGLGRQIVADLLSNGVRVAVVDIDAAAVERLTAELDDMGADALVHVGDVRDASTVEALFVDVDARWNRLDILVNVVGGTFRAPFTETSPRGWDALLRANLSTVLQTCALAVPRMISGGQGGSIINITTIEAHRGAPRFAVYSAAKAAVEQFSRSLAVELAPDRIRVNNVAPDFVPTPNMQEIAGGGLPSADVLEVSIPMGRAGLATDVSHSVVFLASRLSEFITGTTLHPDGGALASSGWFNWPGSGWGVHAPPELVDHARSLSVDGE
jgi:NAD(P)-dependent dehydrogenase (short-subunit alcohol dehydrogenase family)